MTTQFNIQPSQHMKTILAVITIALTLAACGNSENATKGSDASIKNSSLTLPDGTKVTLNGTVAKVITKPNNKGSLNLHEIKFNSSSKHAESSVHSALAKLGYTRKVIQDSNQGFKVHYYKKDQPVIGGIYREQPASESQASQLSMYWQSI